MLQQYTHMYCNSTLHIVFCCWHWLSIVHKHLPVIEYTFSQQNSLKIVNNYQVKCSIQGTCFCISLIAVNVIPFCSEPVLSVTVTPTAARVLDAPSYNSITLTCHVEAPTGLVVRPFLSWKLDGEPVNSSSSHTRNVSDNVTHTTLELTDLTTAGNYQYHCVAMLKIGSDSIREYSAFTMVTIEGKSIITRMN